METRKNWILSVLVLWAFIRYSYRVKRFLGKKKNMKKIRDSSVTGLHNRLCVPPPSRPYSVIFSLSSFEYYQVYWAAIHALMANRRDWTVYWIESVCAKKENWRVAKESHRYSLQMVYIDLFHRMDEYEKSYFKPESLRDIIATVSKTESIEQMIHWLLLCHRDVIEAGYMGKHEFSVRFGIAFAKAVSSHPQLSNDPVLFASLFENAQDEDSVLQYASLYAIKHLAVQDSTRLTDEHIVDLCNDDPYDQMVLMGLLLHLTIKGVDIWTRYGHLDLWNPSWNYNRVELVFLHALRHLRLDIVPSSEYPEIIDCWQHLKKQEDARVRLEGCTSGVIQEMLSQYWFLLEHPKLCNSSFPLLVQHPQGFEILELLMAHPCWEVGTQATASMAKLIPNDKNIFHTLANLFEKTPYTAITLASQLCSQYGNTDILSKLGVLAVHSDDPQIRGHFAESLRQWTQRSTGQDRMYMIEKNQILWNKLAKDEDIWPMHEVRTMARNIKKIHDNPFEFLGLNHNPILCHMPNHDSLSYGAFMAKTLEVQRDRVKKGEARLIPLPKYEKKPHDFSKS